MSKRSKRPAVSVVTPMYNAERYIEAAVRSIRAQTYADFEHIIVNDGSTDGSAAIVRRLMKQDKRLRLLENPRNLGLGKTYNRCFAEARGRYIVLMDADDISAPGRIAAQVAYLQTHPAVGLVATQYRRLSADGRVLRRTRNNLSDAALRFHLLFGVPVCNPSVTLRREALAGLMPAPYNPALAAAPDYDFMLRLAKKWRLHVLPEYLFDYRVHAGGTSKTKKARLIEEVTALALPHIRQTLPKLEVSDAALATFIALQGDPGHALTAAGLKTYLDTLSNLCRAFTAPLPAADRAAVNRFALELEIKTLLGRLKVWKRPRLLGCWLAWRFKTALTPWQKPRKRAAVGR